MELPAALMQGAGDTAVFLLHGVGGGKDIWRRNMPALAQAGYRAIAWDMPGYGDSASIDPYTTEGLARALRDLIRQVGATRNVLLGHSMGGMVAQECIATWPQDVHGLILSGTSPAFGRADGQWQQQFLRDRFFPLDAGQDMGQLAQQLVPAMMAPNATTLARDEATAVMARVTPASYRSALRAIVAFNRRAELDLIRVPTLCLAGQHDRNASPNVMRRLAEHVPGAQYQCLADVGHLANVERPALFDQAVLQFLQTHFPV